MSTDVLRRHVNRQLDHLQTLQARGLPPVTCAFARVEGPAPGQGYRPRFRPGPPAAAGDEAVMTDALFHPSLHATHPWAVSTQWSLARGSHVTLFFPETLNRDPWRGVPEQLPGLGPDGGRDDRAADAVADARMAGERLLALVRTIPTRLGERLGLVRVEDFGDWVEALLHLGWHFPDHGIEARRERILAAADDFPREFRCPELELQLGGVRHGPDVFPGVIVSRLGPNADFLTASVNALRLILEALDGTECGAGPRPQLEFNQLRNEFRRLGQASAGHPRHLTARVLRLGDSFQTPPATAWAGLERGGDGWGVPRVYTLSRRNADRVVCVLHGPGLESFQELANRAGALLPGWPAEPYPAVLADAGAFARYCDPTWSAAAVAAGDGWNRGMVTDHRGNVERWLGVMFTYLMRGRLEHLELVTRPEAVDPTAFPGPVNALLALRGLNPFTASAHVLEASGLVSRPGADGPANERPPQEPQHQPPPADLPPALRHAVERLRDARDRLNGFSDTDADFGELSRNWDRWRVGVAAETLSLAAAWLRGQLDRHPRAPHRAIPDDLDQLWWRVRCWGAGRATTRGEFEGSPHAKELPVLINALDGLWNRLHHLLTYLGIDSAALSAAPPGVTGTASPVTSVGKTGRPPDPTKQEVVKYVRELREKKTPWKRIPDAVFDRFRVRYSAETLRGYLKAG